MEVVASLSQGHTTAAQCGMFTHKSVPVIFEPPCISISFTAITNEPYNLVCECCKEIDHNHTCIFFVNTVCTSVTM